MNINQEPKYEIIDGKLFNRQSGEQIPDDEPIFILRARDMLALGCLVKYWTSILNNEHAEAVHFRIAQFKRFAEQHPGRMKSPDTKLTKDWKNLE